VITIILSLGVVAMGATAMVLAVQLYRARQEQTQLKNQITALRDSERILQTQAYLDPLTGLGNRNFLGNRFRAALERSRRSLQPFALLIIDLDRFKEINDKHGHAAGDFVLVTIAGRLLEAVRASDTVARWGGDEFVLLIESIEERSELDLVGQKLIDLLSERVTLRSGINVSVGGSIGFGVYPVDGGTMEDLLTAADKAMYICKTSKMMPLF